MAAPLAGMAGEDGAGSRRRHGWTNGRLSHARKLARVKRATTAGLHGLYLDRLNVFA
jgi:hypothetical protein